MSMHNHQQFGRGASRIVSTDNTPIGLDEIARWCPSVVATSRHYKRSEQYSYIPTVEILERLDKEGFAPFSVIQGGSREVDKRGFTKHHITLRQKDARSLRVGGTYFEINLGNSHDGTAKYHMFAGAFRLTCLNGMRSDEKTFPGVVVGHRGDVVDKVVGGTYAILEQGERVATKLDQWSKIELTRDEQHGFAHRAAVLRFGNDIPVDTQQLLSVNRLEDRGNDLWHTFNRVQENVIRGGLAFDRVRKSGQVIHAHTREVKSVDGDVKLNRSLWALAEEVAQLKIAA